MPSSKVLAIASLFAALAIPATASAGGSLLSEVAGALNPQLCGGSGCWTNHMRLTDIDGDDDLDAIFVNYADFFNGTDSPQVLAFYANDGSGGFSNVSAAAVGGISTNAHQICIADVDGDGAGDIYVPDGTGTEHHMLMNDGSGVYTNEAVARLPADVPNSGACRFGDMDGDGDMDLVLSDGYGSGSASVLMWANDGTGVFTEVAGAFNGAVTGLHIDDIELFDADRDFDLDVFANAHENGFGGYYINDGTGSFEGQTFPPPQPGGSGFHYNAAPCDVDADGDLDMWIDNIGGGFTEQLLINDGSGVFTDETGDRVTGNPGVDDNGIACADLDNDGDFDGVVLSLSTAERLLDNDGTGNFTFMAGAFPNGTDSTLWAEFGDIDGDNRLDLVTAQGEFNDQTNKVYVGTKGQPVDDQAPTIIAVQNEAWETGDDPVVRFAVSDRAMSDEGPRLSRAFVAVDPDGDNTLVEASFIGGDLFAATLPTVDDDGYEYTVCAEDRAGNLQCSDPFDIGEGGGADTGDTGDTGADDTADGTADQGSGDDDPGDDAPDDGPGDDGPGDDGPGDDGPVATDSGSDGTGDGGADDDNGSCSCRASNRLPPASLLLLLAVGVPLLRRRR